MPYAHLLSHDPSHANQRYWNGSSEPTYPFGYGLSYTSFAYSDLRIERAQIKPGEPVTMSVELKNTGARTGDEVAQLYLHQRSGTSSRPVRELKGFQRVSLKAGAKRRLGFTLKPRPEGEWVGKGGG